MELVSLEQRFAVNPFVNNVEVDKMPEAVQETGKPTLDEKIERCMGQYDKFDKMIYHSENQIKKMQMEILNPTQIQILTINLAKRKINDKDYGRHITKYITELIQRSYLSGYNNFTVDMQDRIFNSMGESLEGDSARFLNLKLFGNVGEHLCAYSKYCIIDVFGNTEEGCGHYSRYNTFLIRGNVGDKCGGESENSNYTVYGNASDHLGNGSNSSTYNIIGDTGEHCGGNSNNCTFKISGDAGEYCGHRSEHCTIDIKGNAGIHHGYNSKNCNYLINGDAGIYCGDSSEDCTFIIEGEVYGFLAASSKKSRYIISNFSPSMFKYTMIPPPEKCVFATKNEEAYRQMISISRDRCNKAQLLDKDNSILEEAVFL